MKLKKHFRNAFIFSGTAILLSACAPEIGSKQWCDDLDEIPKSEWSENEAVNYVKFCLTVSKDE